ncbi:hypothetical protein MKW94_021829 [Papaver nudicaule]|uniref:B box-type domain-containing protein n=1 Tax=Papaver nudicaule TaxID=74823 RepID=A0AA41SGX7_PAPNU|nr:hypothetical protein [Papaver nudicaule]
MKECELCEAPARMFCESDQASLCWDCDEKVHCANFLVARHTRSLLCHSCQSPTPWKASGSKLGPTISICERCVKRCNGNDQREEDNDDEESHKDGDDDDDDDEDQFHDADENDDNGDDVDDEVDETDDDEDEDADNQVVPWSSTPPPPPIPSCSSSSEESSSSSRLVVCNGRDFSSNGTVVGGGEWNTATVSLPLKRMREKLDLTFHQDEIGCSPSPSNYNSTSPAIMISRRKSDQEEEVATSVVSFRPLKDRRLALTSTSTSTSTTLISSLKRFEQKIVSSKEVEESSQSILAICKLSKDPRAI